MNQILVHDGIVHASLCVKAGRPLAKARGLIAAELALGKAGNDAEPIFNGGVSDVIISHGGVHRAIVDQDFARPFSLPLEKILFDVGGPG